jgi:hypothetical protein
MTLSQPVCLGIKHPTGAYEQIFITVGQLRVCWCGALSLWREHGSVVYNCSWSSSAQSFLNPGPVGLVITFYCLRFETPHPGGPGPRLYTPPSRNRVAWLYPQVLRNQLRVLTLYLSENGIWNTTFNSSRYSVCIRCCVKIVWRAAGKPGYWSPHIRLFPRQRSS